jgi:hypothetical protein
VLALKRSVRPPSRAFTVGNDSLSEKLVPIPLKGLDVDLANLNRPEAAGTRGLVLTVF